MGSWDMEAIESILSTWNTSDYNLPAQVRAHSKNGCHCEGHDHSWWHGVNLNVCGFP